MEETSDFSMTAASILQHITGTYADLHLAESDGSTFIFVGEERNFPLATLVTTDGYDKASDLDRPGVFRLNIGIGKPTFISLFGPVPSRPGADGVIESGHDYTALDHVMPHPVYGMMFWVCVLNPSEKTFQEKVKPLLKEAYEMVIAKQSKKAENQMPG